MTKTAHIPQARTHARTHTHTRARARTPRQQGAAFFEGSGPDKKCVVNGVLAQVHKLKPVITCVDIARVSTTTTTTTAARRPDSGLVTTSASKGGGGNRTVEGFFVVS